MHTHILFISNDHVLAPLVELELQVEGYQIMLKRDGASGLIAARETQPDLLILDGALPVLSGLEICRRLRSTGDKTPIILLNQSEAPRDCVAALDAGVDDYVRKPFSIDELCARVRARLRRRRITVHPDILRFDDLSLRPETREVYRGGRSIKLTAKEFDFLGYLIAHARQVLSRDRILEAIWGYDFMGDSNVIEVYVRSLRRKLEANHESRLIHTIRGVGYVLRETRLQPLPQSA